jgi:hypothetical protein
MKICPQCSRSFDDSFFFCLEDGAALPSPSTPRETEQLFIKSAETEVFPGNFQTADNENYEKKDRRLPKLLLLPLAIFFVIGSIFTAFLVFKPSSSGNTTRNQKQTNERPTPVQSNKNASLAAANQTVNSQNSAKTNESLNKAVNESANVKTNTANVAATNEIQEKPAETTAKGELPKLKQGMPYAIARRMLLNNGWQTATFSPNRELFGNMDYIVNKLGFYEVENCSGTGAGFCRFLFTSAVGRKLTVVTVNNEEDAPGGPSLSSWTIEN